MSGCTYLAILGHAEEPEEITVRCKCVYSAVLLLQTSLLGVELSFLQLVMTGVPEHNTTLTRKRCHLCAYSLTTQDLRGSHHSHEIDALVF